MSVNIQACEAGTPGYVLKAFRDYSFNKVAEWIFTSKVTLLKFYLWHLWRFFPRCFYIGGLIISREEVGSLGFTVVFCFVLFPESELKCRLNFCSYALAELVFHLVFSLSKKLQSVCLVTVHFAKEKDMPLPTTKAISMWKWWFFFQKLQPNWKRFNTLVVTIKKKKYSFF